MPAKPTVKEMRAAKVNPRSGLATDYLNMFNEAIMLFEMALDMPEMADELSTWSPKSYTEHFEASGFEMTATVLAAYETAEPDLKADFDTLCAHTCETFLTAIGQVQAMDLSDDGGGFEAQAVLEDLKSLQAKLDGMIHNSKLNAGEPEATVDTTQAEIDALF